MKKLIATIGLACLSLSLHGQGVVSFTTLGGGANAPVTNSATGLRVSGTAFLAQLFYALGNVADPQSSAFVEVAGAPASFGTAAAAGYILTSTGGGNRVLNGVAPGSAVTFQVRAWDAAFGATYDAARTSAGRNFAAFGQGGSALAFVASLGSATGASSLAGLNPGWYATPVPEPSVIALGILGGLGVILLRRRK